MARPDHVVDAIHARLAGDAASSTPVRTTGAPWWRRVALHVRRTAEIGCLVMVAPALAGPVVGVLLAELARHVLV